MQLSGLAGAAGAVVTLSSSSPDGQVPTSVKVLTDQISAPIVVTSSPVASNETVTITASLGFSSQTKALTLNPAPIASFNVNPSTITGGVNTSGVVVISGFAASPNGATVTLSSSSPDVQVPASVLIKAGATTASFVITTSVVSAPEPGLMLTATLGGSQITATVSLQLTKMRARAVTTENALKFFA